MQSAPTFMVIGAMKSGTTSLWQYLNAHPDIFMCYPKEPGYFAEKVGFRQGWKWYTSLFGNAGEARQIGEASTYYTMAPVHNGVVDRVAERLPDVKLIYLMRNPVSRAISHYWHNVGRFGERRPIEKAIRPGTEYVDFGRYAYQMAPWLGKFPRDRFHFASFEDLKSNPTDVVRGVYRFLEVDDSVVPSITGEVFNGTPQVLRAKRRLLHAIRWSPWWDRVSPFVPTRLKEFGKRLEFRSIPRSKDIPPRLIDDLQRLYRGENERLFDQLGHVFPAWCEGAIPATAEY